MSDKYRRYNAANQKLLRSFPSGRPTRLH